MGHTCSVTSFDFNDNLKIIVSGSADNTVKFWPMKPDDPKELIIYKAIKSENLIWPVKTKIEKYSQDQNEYISIVLCANLYCYLNFIEQVDDFKNDFEHDKHNVYNFRYKIQISDSIKSYINLKNTFLDNNSSFDFYEEDEYEQEFLISNKSWILLKNGILSLFLITDNNAFRQKKAFTRQYLVKKNEKDQVFDIDFIDSKYCRNNDEHFEFINRMYFETYNIQQFEIISFGFK